MSRRSLCLAIALVLLSSIGSATVATPGPAADSGTAEALLEALGHVPLATAASQSPISYLDQAALVAARPGAAQPASLAVALAGLDAGDPAMQLWLAAFMGASSGNVELLRSMASGAADWPERIGFDLLDIQRQLTFGTPPSDGSVLMGAFDPAAISTAFEARGYRSSVSGDRTRLCGAAGCEAGLQVDLANADPALPFGGSLGRSEPLSVTGRDLLVSADDATLQAMEGATRGEVASVAADPAYRGLVLAADPDVTLTQASLMPGGMLGMGPDIYALLAGSPEAATQLLAGLADTFEPMPPAEAVAIMDGATDAEQVVTVALAFRDEADAATAADVLPRRLTDPAMPAVTFGGSLAALLEDRGVTDVTGSVVAGESGRLPVARIEVRAPLPGDAPEATSGRPLPSGGLYRLFVDLVSRRDLLWLAPVLPLE